MYGEDTVQTVLENSAKMPGHISPDLQPLAPSHTFPPVLPLRPCTELNPARSSLPRGVFAQILIGREIGLDPQQGRWKRGRKGWGSFPGCQDCCESELGESSMDEIRRGLCPTSRRWDVLSHVLLSIVELAASCAGTDGGWQREPLCGRARTAAHHCPHQDLPWLISVLSIC